MHKAWCQVPQGTKFYIKTPNIFSAITAVFFIKNCIITEQKLPDNSDVHRSVQNSGSSVWYSL